MPHPLEQESWSAAVKSLPLAKRTYVLTVVGLIVTVAAFLIPIVMNRGSDREVRATDNERTNAVSSVQKPSPAPSPMDSQNNSAVDSKETSKTHQPEKRDPAYGAAAHVAKARALYHQRNYQQALVECGKALRVDPQNKEAQLLKARIERTVQILAENDKSAP